VEQIEGNKVGRKTSLTPEIQEKLLAYIRKGLTYERAGEALEYRQPPFRTGKQETSNSTMLSKKHGVT